MPIDWSVKPDNWQVANQGWTEFHLQSAITKVRRAITHMDELKPITDTYGQTSVGKVVVDPESDPNCVTYFCRVTHYPFGVAAVAGDILSNLRASLDHLAFGVIPEDDRAHTNRYTQFPILSENPDKSRSAMETWVRQTWGMNDAAKRLLWSIQPCNAVPESKDSLVIGRWLERISRATNTDKHRHLAELRISLNPRIDFPKIKEGRRVGAAGDVPMNPRLKLEDYQVIDPNIFESHRAGRIDLTDPNVDVEWTFYGWIELAGWGNRDWILNQLSGAISATKWVVGTFSDGWHSLTNHR